MEVHHQITIITIKDAIRIFELEVGNEIYGYYGQTEKWNDLEGGANQMNTVFSWQLMLNTGIITTNSKIIIQ